jgi:hypothetical protein
MLLHLAHALVALIFSVVNHLVRITLWICLKMELTVQFFICKNRSFHYMMLHKKIFTFAPCMLLYLFYSNQLLHSF